MQKTRTERQIDFLRDCLELMEGELCNKNDWKWDFYNNALRSLLDDNKLPTSKLRSCDPDPKEKSEKTYQNWMHKFRKSINDNASRLKNNLSEHNLTKMPFIEVVVGGGAGVESYFRINIRGIDNICSSKNNGDASYTVSISDEYNKSMEKCTDIVSYRTTKIRRLPWYLAVISPAFKSGKGRFSAAIMTLVFTFVVLPLLTILLTIFALIAKPEAKVYLLVFIALFSFQMYITPKAILIFRLLIQQITIVRSIFLPSDYVCISELSNIEKASDSVFTIERSLTFSVVSADCPICKRMYGLENSVSLINKRIFGTFIIGTCWNNPMMHKYTFDKDLMEGDKLS